MSPEPLTLAAAEQARSVGGADGGGARGSLVLVGAARLDLALEHRAQSRDGPQPRTRRQAVHTGSLARQRRCANQSRALAAQLAVLEEARTSRPSAGEGLGITLSVRS